MRKIVTAILCAFALIVSVFVGAPAFAADPPVSLFSAGTPANPNYADKAIVLGQQFKANKSGNVTGIKFYKGTANTGTHVGGIYQGSTLLGSVTFTGETASGWQTANLATPVKLTAGTTYKVAYTAARAFNRDTGYFNSGRTVSTSDGSLTTVGAGLYSYGTTLRNPTSSNGLNTNYWADVVFAADSTTPPPPVTDWDGSLAYGTPVAGQPTPITATVTAPDGPQENKVVNVEAWQGETKAAIGFVEGVNLTGTTAHNITLPALAAGTYELRMMVFDKTATGWGTFRWHSVEGPMVVPSAPANTLECPTYGTGGAWTDRTFQNFTASNGLTSQYHIYAAGLDPTKPVGVTVQLHGDSASTFPYPNSGKIFAMSEVVDDKNMIFVAPKSPDRQGTVTWWENRAANIVWLNDLLDREVFGKYNIEKDRVWLAGSSGGSDFQTRGYLDTLFPKICGGGTLIAAGGSTTLSGENGETATPDMKADFPMHFYTGQQDTAANASDGYCGYCAATASADHWEGLGFRVTRNFPPELNHYNLNEPAELDKLLDLHVPAP